MAAQKIRVILFGVGSIGAEVARLLGERAECEIVGALDTDPGKNNCDLAQLTGAKQPTGIRVSDNARAVLRKPADVVVLATGSSLEKVQPDLKAIVRARHNVVSTCEELAEPWAQSPSAAAALDRLAKEHEVTVLGTGVNPGFAMDTLPLTLSAACQQVTRVRVRRVVDASKRRMQLQKKIGTGLSPAAFAEAAARLEIRHVGLAESASLIARGLGWKLDAVQQDIVPALATRHIVTDFFTVETGFVTGIRQSARGLVGGVERITLDLQMSVDAPESVDEVWIEGRPNVHALVNGIHGDLSTAAMVANALPGVVAARPGLLTMLDLPLVHARAA